DPPCASRRTPGEASVTSRDHLLAIDAGGSLVKATLFAVAGGESHTRARSVPLTRPAPGQNERDPEVLWSATVECVRDVLGALEHGAQRVLAVGFTGHGNGLYLVDAAG